MGGRGGRGNGVKGEVGFVEEGEGEREGVGRGVKGT